MDIKCLTAFFMWCTIINGGILILSSLMCLCAKDWAYSIHSRFFPMPRDTHSALIFSFVGFYKIMVITFNLIPYLVLLIIA
ncbi:MAG: hypothetical protein KAS75_05245 [Planctomycetes bacterium]|nr:hypothetical protein [Planctomycetota bacterium]